MADGAFKIEHHGTGHCARLRKRLFEQQGESLHDHELVEYLPALAIPRRDTKQIAKDLIVR
jgi:DNA repair protein RadC